MSQQSDLRAGAYYVSIRHGSKTMLALGPFRRHSRALGVVDAARLLIMRAGLDPWSEFGYGTCRLPISSALRVGALNTVMHTGPDRFGGFRFRPAQNLGAAILARLASD